MSKLNDLNRGTLTDTINTANAVINEHWRRPDEPWTPKCTDCHDSGCPRLAWAEDFIADLNRLRDRRDR